jgi:hypothetical protein
MTKPRLAVWMLVMVVAYVAFLASKFNDAPIWLNVTTALVMFVAIMRLAWFFIMQGGRLA